MKEFSENKPKIPQSPLSQEARSLDMAMEAHQLLRGEAGRDISGVSHSQQQFACGSIHTIRILNDQGAEAMGRDVGTYVTIEVPELKSGPDRRLLEEVSAAIAQTLRTLLPQNYLQGECGRQSVLVVGLGNFQTTADAIGPKVISHIQPTLHFYQRDFASDLRPVCAMSPGVVGNTGIETAVIIKSVVTRLRPSALIAVDSLAARELANVMNSIQICNTGIRPGSGVKNRRLAVNTANLGVPVIAIGIPTVVHGATIIREALRLSRQSSQEPAPDDPQDDQIIAQLLQPFANDLVLAPKEADMLVPQAARIIAAGITRALHPGADSATFREYMQQI